MLYSSNYFYFAHKWQQTKLYRFLSPMPSHRSHHIRRLRLDYWVREFPPIDISDIKEWNDMWSFLSKTLHNLLVFTLKIVTPLMPLEAYHMLCYIDQGWLEPVIGAPMVVKLQFRTLGTVTKPGQDLDVALPKPTSETVGDACHRMAQCCEAVLEEIRTLFKPTTTKG